MFKDLFVFSDMICNLETQSHHSPHKQICYFSNQQELPSNMNFLERTQAVLLLKNLSPSLIYLALLAPSFSLRRSSWNTTFVSV